MSAFDGSRPGGMDGGISMEDLMTEMFGDLGGMPGMGGFPGMNGQTGPRKPRKGEDEEKQLPVTLEDLYLGKTQRFSATKIVVCGHCKGKGAKEGAKAKKCSSCQGQGEHLMYFMAECLPILRSKTGSTSDGTISHSSDSCMRYLQWYRRNLLGKREV